MTDDRGPIAPLAAGILAAAEAARRAAAHDRRGRARDLRRQGLLGDALRRRGRRARLRGRRRRGRGHADRPAHPLRHRHRRLGAGLGRAAGDRGRRGRPAVRPRRRRALRLRPERPDGGAADARRVGDRRPLGARPPARALQLAEMDLLALFGTQAALALDLLERSRRAQALLAEDGEGREAPPSSPSWPRRSSGSSDPGRRRAALDMVDALVRLLRESQGPPTIRLRRR